MYTYMYIYVYIYIASINQTDKWMTWKTKNDEWSRALKQASFHQLLVIHKETQATCWGFKIKVWWRKGDMRVTKRKKLFECWV